MVLGAFKGKSNIVDAGSIAGINDSLIVITIGKTGTYFFPVGIIKVKYNTVCALTLGADIDKILGSFSEHVGILDLIFSPSLAIDLVALYEVKTFGELRDTGFGMLGRITLCLCIHVNQQEEGKNTNQGY
jgi:hypothetical protein